MIMNDHVPESDEVGGHIYRLAQANRLVRWLKSGGDEAEYRAMLGPDNKIKPEPEDIEAAKNDQLEEFVPPPGWTLPDWTKREK
jgi:hypothetical protein